MSQYHGILFGDFEKMSMECNLHDELSLITYKENNVLNTNSVCWTHIETPWKMIIVVETKLVGTILLSHDP